MALTIKRVDYYYSTVHDVPGAAFLLLSKLAGSKINLLAFGAVPFGPGLTQLTLFPEDADRLTRESVEMGLDLEGPHPALLVRGDDELGALSDIHARLYDAKVNVYSSTGVTDGRGGYGYVLYVRPDEVDAASIALGI